MFWHVQDYGHILGITVEAMNNIHKMQFMGLV